MLVPKQKFQYSILVNIQLEGDKAPHTFFAQTQRIDKYVTVVYIPEFDDYISIQSELIICNIRNIFPHK